MSLLEFPPHQWLIQSLPGKSPHQTPDPLLLQRAITLAARPQRAFRKQNRAEQAETCEGIHYERCDLWEQGILLQVAILVDRSRESDPGNPLES